MWLKMDLAVAFFFAQFFVFKVRGLLDCPYDVANVVADKTPSYLLFNQTLEPSSLVCMWPIKSNYFDTRVQLNFPQFHLIHSSLANKGDCVDIYDGSENRYQADLVDTICNRPPAREYNSTGRYLTVVFRQGNLLGTRWFSMNYSTIAKSDEKGEEENPFFASLVGRLVSFAILLTILSSCSAILRRGRRSSNNLQNCCQCMEECLVGVQVCICNFFLWLWSGVRAASQRLCACVGAAFQRSETGNGEEETADRPRSPDHTFTTITTITANSAPDLTDVVTDRRPRSSSTSSENSTLSFL